NSLPAREAPRRIKPPDSVALLRPIQRRCLIESPGTGVAQPLGFGQIGFALTCVGDLPSACFELLFEGGERLTNPTNRRVRSLRMKLATSPSALCPLAGQGHLHRRTSPECWPSHRVTGPAERIARLGGRFPGISSSRRNGSRPPTDWGKSIP